MPSLEAATLSFEPGQLVSHYRIVKRLGTGGMGEVYLAEDEQLERQVALKILLPEFARDTGRARRFLREARVAAGLSHPSIISVFEIGDHDSVAFIAMEYVRGDTLRSRLIGTPLEISEALSIARQIAEALAYAHEAGIVHRDIKPENVMLTGAGHLKVLDFGLAHETSVAARESSAELPTLTQLTMPGHAVGTPAYMSPEQLRGLPVDARTDIFALGVLLYEMLAGRRPFDAASHADSVLRVLSTPPDALARLNYSVPEALERVVRKCLEKDPAWRYQSARELAIDLSALQRDSDIGVLAAATGAAPPLPPSRTARSWRRVAAWGTAGLAVVLGIALTAYVLASRPRAIDSIAVLPFTNASGNASLDYAAEGLAESVQRSLSRAPGINIPARARVQRFGGGRVDPVSAARELAVGAVLTGRIREQPDGVALTVELVDARDGSQLWTQTYLRTTSQLVTVDDDVVTDLAARLQWTLPPRSRQKDGRAGNPAAEDAYLKARFHLGRRSPADLQQAVRYFQEAIDKDPAFASAYAGLGDTYALIANYGVQPPVTILPQARAAAHRALELDPTIAEAHTSLAFATAFTDFNWTAAEQSFRQALALDPEYAQAHAWFALVVLTPLKRFEEAIIEARRGVELEPDEPIRVLTLVTVLYMARRYDEAIAQLSRIDASYLAPAQQALQALCLAGNGRTAAAVNVIAGEQARPDQTVQFNRAVLAYTLARDGRAADARRIADALARESQQAYGSACLRATIEVALRKTDTAFRLLDECFAARDVEFRFLSVDARYDPLRGDQRFKALLRRAGLP